MLIYRNHKQLKTNTSHNDRALSVTIRTGQSGKKILIFFIFTHKATSRKMHLNSIAFRQASTTSRRVAKVFVDR
jgi:hypothetical protein